jgi:hypothetical protein
LEEKIIQFGIPQGFISGPLLFLIYMNDIDTNIMDDIGIRLALFADYTRMLIPGKDMQDLTVNLNKINKSLLPWSDSKD